MIRVYLAQIRAIVDRYAVTSFVLDTKVSFEARPGDQGYLTGSITYADGSVLHFREFLDAAGETVDKLTYTYHYQDAGNQLIFRYDNARHRPLLRSLEHKHAPGQVVEMPAPALDEVLAEIATIKGWV